MKVAKNVIKAIDMFGFPVSLNFDRKGNTH